MGKIGRIDPQLCRKSRNLASRKLGDKPVLKIRGFCPSLTLQDFEKCFVFVVVYLQVVQIFEKIQTYSLSFMIFALTKPLSPLNRKLIKSQAHGPGPVL